MLNMITADIALIPFDSKDEADQLEGVCKGGKQSSIKTGSHALDFGTG